MKKISEVWNDSKLATYFKKEPEITVVEEEPKSKHTAVKVFAVIGIIAVVAGIAFALYKYFKPDYLDEDEDDYIDDDDDFFDDEEL